jgi:hypothetical protein
VCCRQSDHHLGYHRGHPFGIIITLPYREFICGHCARPHPTWECESGRGVPIANKYYTNYGGGHRLTNKDCPVKREARKVAEQVRAQWPPYHRIPLHFRSREKVAPE